MFATAYPNRVALPDCLRRFAGSAGVLNDTPVNVMTERAGSLLRLKKMLPMKTRFVLDYFHVAMKLRHIDHSVGRIPPCRLSPGGWIFEVYDRSSYLRAYVWSGRRDKFEESFHTMPRLLDRAKVLLPDDADAATAALGHVCDLWGDLRTNAAGVVNYQA